MTRAGLRGTIVAVLVLLSACSSSTSKSFATASTTSSSTTSTTSVPTTSSVAGTSTSSPPSPTVSPSSPAPSAPTTAATSPTGPPPGPRIDAFLVSNPAACAAPDASFSAEPPMVTVSWVAKAAESVYLAIDNVDGPYATDLALSGSAQLPFACPGPHTYYVVAISGEQKVSDSQTVG